MPFGGETQALTLPQLTPRSVPKRYEETRPVAIQGFAHTKILGLGHELHQRQLEQAELDKLQAVRKAEQAVWEEAEKIKAAALTKAREEAAHEQERVIKKLNKAHEKAIREEALKVEMAMQKLAIEQVKQERAEGEARLLQAVKQTEERCHRELLAAVAKAREEERKIAADEAARVALANKEKFDSAMKKAENEKSKALKDLRDQKDLEKAKVVQEAEGRERRVAKEMKDAQARQYEAVIKNLQNTIDDKQHEIQKHLAAIADLEKAKAHVENCLLDTRKDFQEFIDTLPPYDRRQAEFLIPIVYLDELERKGYEVQPFRPPRTKTKSNLKKKAIKQ